MSLAPSDNLPRLLYIGDVPVAGTIAGAALLYRLLGSYPSNQLLLCGPTADGAAMVSSAHYIGMNAPWPWILRTRWSGLYCAWAFWRGLSIPCWLSRLAREFQPQAVLTIAHAGAWATAWKLAERLRLPLFMLAHDDYAFSMCLPEWLRPRANRLFAEVYRDSKARFCISPAMAETYAGRYGVPGQVIYPTRDPANTVFTEPAPQAAITRSSMAFAYAGSIHGEANLRQVLDFARVAGALGHRLIVFSPQHAVLKQMAAGTCPGLEARQPVPSAQLLPRLRDEADCLLATGSFDPGQKDVTSTLFPSKLADYSAVGLPILVWAPEYASVTRFVREHAHSAELVTDSAPDALRSTIGRLASSPERRRQLAEGIITAGQLNFSPEAAWQTFSAALTAR